MKAIIVGAGIGGLTAALALQRVGIDVCVCERAPEAREVGAGISLWTNAIRALERLGLGDAIRARTLSDMQGAIRTWRGDILAPVTSDELKRRYGVAVVLLHRADLLALLLNQLPADKIHFGYECVGFSQDVEGVKVQFADKEAVCGDVLLGADGLRSIIRERLFQDGAPRYAGYTAWRAVARFDGAGLGSSESWGAGRRFGLIPLNDGRMFWFATNNAPQGEQDQPGQAKAKLQRLFRGWHEPIEAVLAATEESSILRNDIYDRDPLGAWSVNRITLLGDAAHPMTPNLGQGGCQAIEDALVLAVCLARRADIPAAFRQYETRRIRRTSEIVLSSRRLGRLAQLQNPFFCFLRNAAIRATPKFISARRLSSVAGYDPLTKDEAVLLCSGTAAAAAPWSA